MIITHKDMTPEDNPPSYDLVIEGSGDPPSEPSPAKQPAVAKPLNQSTAVGPPHTTQPAHIPDPVVYHYVNPVTDAHVASLLPPNHPEMLCLQAGKHVPQTRYGLLGILAAVFWFPLGIGLCLLDRRVKCSRCGHHIDDGICG